jgi:hypothetical protein
LVNGETVTQRIDDVDGNHTRPPSHERVLAKFKANAAMSLRPEGVEMLSTSVEGLGHGGDVTAIGQALGQLAHPIKA